MPDTEPDATPSSGAPPSPAGADAARPRRSGEPGRGPRRSRSRRPAGGKDRTAPPPGGAQRAPQGQPELPDPPGEGRADPAAAERALVRKPQIGDSRPAPPPAPPPPPAPAPAPAPARPRRADRPRGSGDQPRGPGERRPPAEEDGGAGPGDGQGRRRRRRGSRGKGGGRTRAPGVVEGTATSEDAVDLDEEVLARRRGRERKGRPIGRYLMCVHTRDSATQIAILEGRSLTEHYVSRATNDDTEIHGNLYLGRVQNVLPGMEAAFVDIGTPKNAVLYRGDVQYEAEDIEHPSAPRIEQMLRPGQQVLCQVTKNPIGAKGARLTQEVSLAGRFVVLVPSSTTYGISKRLTDNERRRLRQVLDDVRPAEHGLIVRTAAEGATALELQRDVDRLLGQWRQIEAQSRQVRAPALLYREPPLAQRVIREEFTRDYRGVLIDDPDLYADIRAYVDALIPELADRVQLYDDPDLPLFERHHVHEQLHKAVDRKVWLPSGGSLIIERTEALTVVDVNTGKNVGSSNLEETVFRNNLEAADEIARQLRLRDIGGIIVVDFIDMEVKANRDALIRQFRDALARDKTRTQVFDVSELGLVEMTRKRVSEGLVESFSEVCRTCDGRGLVFPDGLL